MIIEIPDDNSIVRWRYKDNEDWKSAEISDLIKAYERPKVTVFAENASKEEIEDFKQELENVLERPKGEWIHVSDELPQDRDWYLGVFREPDTGYIIDLPFVCDYVGYPTEGTTNDAWILRGLTDIDNPSIYYKNLECVAWQPLPERYKKGGAA